MLIFCKHCGLLLPAGHHTCPPLRAPAPQPVTPPVQPPLYQEQSSTQTIHPRRPRYNAAQPKNGAPWAGRILRLPVPVCHPGGWSCLYAHLVHQRAGAAGATPPGPGLSDPQRYHLGLVLVAALLFSAYVSSMTYRMFYSPYFY